MNVQVPEVGSKAVDFTLPDTELKVRSLSEFKGKKVVLAFFPAALSPVCTREMCTFRDHFDELSRAGAEIIGISVDGPFANKQFKEVHGINFPLLSDYNREVISRYGIVMRDLLHIKEYKAAKRSVFVLDRDGVVRYRWVSDNPLIEPNYEEIKQVIKSLP